MKKKELQKMQEISAEELALNAEAKRLLAENFQFDPTDKVKIVATEEDESFACALKKGCKALGVADVKVELSCKAGEEPMEAVPVEEPVLEDTPVEEPALEDAPVEATPIETVAEETFVAQAEEVETAPIVEEVEVPTEEVVEEAPVVEVEEEATSKTAETEAEPVEEKSEIILDVKDLKKYFVVGKNFFGKATAYLKAVDNVSFTLKRGKTLGIVGESGCGKTTMGRTILRLYNVTGGEVWFNGKEVSKIKDKAFNKLRPNMQMIFQDPYASLSPRLTVGEIIGEAARQHGLVDKANFREYVLNVMKMCGLQPHYFDRYPHEFSGGQRQRICIARALALKPELVICDEPVSALDVSIQAQIINMLRDLQKELGLTYIFISHDLSVVKHISDEVGVMYLGSMVEYGSKERIFSNTLHPYTKALFSAVPVPNPHVKMNRVILKGDIPSPVNPPKGCKFHTRCDQCMEICKTVAPKYKEVEEGHFCACHLYANEEERAAMMEAPKKKSKADKK